jgi:sirohydrochlorin cobaltochelatase
MMPMLIVAGDHARSDLAGDQEDSWKSILEKEGYETEVILKGLGEIDAIAEVFADHAREAENLLDDTMEIVIERYR